MYCTDRQLAPVAGGSCSSGVFCFVLFQWRRLGSAKGHLDGGLQFLMSRGMHVRTVVAWGLGSMPAAVRGAATPPTPTGGMLECFQNGRGIAAAAGDVQE